MTDSIKPAISPEHQWHGVLTNDYGAEIEAFGALGVDPDEDGTRWAYPPVQYTRTELVDPAAIREAAIREAADVAVALELKWWKEYKDRLSPHCADPQYQGMSDGAGDVAAAILELIGEKK